ncbi:MAG: hypothetical protein F6K36_01550 [Symploca sp. SIO3C6]|nr:hypothetical protein [Symploca sp. SIO3C6]
MILTNQEQLIQNYNFSSATQYQAQSVVTTHSLSQIQMLKGIYGTLETTPKLQLTFKAIGQLRLSRTTTEVVRPIEEIKIDISKIETTNQ